MLILSHWLPACHLDSGDCAPARQLAHVTKGRTPAFPVKNAKASAFDLLTREFFARKPERVARELLGKLLVRKIGRNPLVGRIVEVEAYLGADDLAAHAAAGLTKRNAVLFGPA